MWRRVYTSIDVVSHAMGRIAGAVILVMAFMLVAEIVLRNVANVSLTFVWEYAAYMHIAAIFLGLAVTLRTGGHIQVTLLATALPRAFHYISALGGLALSSYLTIAMIRLCYNWGSTGRTSGTVDNLPLVYPMIFVSFGALILTLQLLCRVLHLMFGTQIEQEWGDSPSAE